MISRTTDLAAVERIFNHPMVYRWCCDDASPDKYVAVPETLYIMNEDKSMVCRVDPFTGTSCMIHIAADPEIWGKTEPIAREGLAWIFQNTLYNKIHTMAPEFNRLAIRLARQCGFEQEGVLRKSFQKNWKLYDMIVFGLSKYQGGALCQ